MSCKKKGPYKVGGQKGRCSSTTWSPPVHMPVPGQRDFCGHFDSFIYQSVIFEKVIFFFGTGFPPEPELCCRCHWFSNFIQNVPQCSVIGCSCSQSVSPKVSLEFLRSSLTHQAHMSYPQVIFSRVVCEVWIPGQSCFSDFVLSQR